MGLCSFFVAVLFLRFNKRTLDRDLDKQLCLSLAGALLQVGDPCWRPDLMVYGALEYEPTK